jgi:hypothetical protein
LRRDRTVAERRSMSGGVVPADRGKSASSLSNF